MRHLPVSQRGISLLGFTPGFWGERAVRCGWQSVAAAVACVWVAGPASAAELRITLPELAGLVQAVMGSAKLHLNTKPGGLLSGANGSYLQIAGNETAIPLAPKSFSLFGSTYAYYVDDLNSESIKVSATGSAVRLTLNFPAKETYLAGGCVTGECGLTDALPKIVWKNASVVIDATPVRLGSSITMQVKSMSIGGLLSARCTATGNIFTEGACKVGLSWANRTIAKLKPDIAAQVKDRVNDPKTQSDVANGLKKFLTIGQSGEIAITDVKSDAKAVTISFQLSENAGG
jgi:hypothetical protein